MTIKATILSHNTPFQTKQGTIGCFFKILHLNKEVKCVIYNTAIAQTIAPGLFISFDWWDPVNIKQSNGTWATIMQVKYAKLERENVVIESPETPEAINKVQEIKESETPEFDWENELS